MTLCQNHIYWPKLFSKYLLSWNVIHYPILHSVDPPTYHESVGGAVSIVDEDDGDDPDFNMGDLTYTPMYAYVYNYRPPPAYADINGSPRIENLHGHNNVGSSI